MKKRFIISNELRRELGQLPEQQEAIQIGRKQALEEVEKWIDVKEFSFNGLIHDTICCGEYGCDEVMDNYKKWLKAQIKKELEKNDKP